jgi:Transglutaminase-like superfamily
LRLEPRPYEGLTVLNWQGAGDGVGVLPRLVDGLGNIGHCRTINRPHREALFTAGGEVETRRADGIALGTVEPLPPLFLLRATDRLHRLMNRVRDRLDYRPAAGNASTTAARALAQGLGVCHDHAHVFCAAARLMGIPAR